MCATSSLSVFLMAASIIFQFVPDELQESIGLSENLPMVSCQYDPCGA